MDANIFASGFYLHRDKCYYVDEHHTLWCISPYHDERLPLVITKVRIFDRTVGHPPYEHEVLSEIKHNE